MTWISTKELLPETNKQVLITIHGDAVVERNAHWAGRVFVAALTADRDWWSIGAHCGGIVKPEHVTAWSFLPSARKTKLAEDTNMTKKHFIALADAIRDYNADAPSIGQKQFTQSQIALLADFCYQQNSQFNRHRWLGYIAGECGPNGVTRGCNEAHPRRGK